MSSQVSLPERLAWIQSQGQTLGAEVAAYVTLIHHEDCRWQELLNGLNRPGIVAEQAWLHLRSLLPTAGVAASVRKDVEFWQAEVQKRGVNLDSRCNLPRG